MKKIIFILALLSIFSFASAEELRIPDNQAKTYMDFDLKFYTPSLLGFVTGANPLLGLRENPDEITTCNNYMIEMRGSIASIKRVSFSWALGMHSYIENKKNPSKDLLSMNLSVGSGVYFHLFDKKAMTLSGLCLYLYPVYQIPIYTQNHKPYLKWLSAFDFGYNFSFIQGLMSVYPYLRYVVGWSAHDVRQALDCGIALGINFPNGNKLSQLTVTE